VVQVHRQLLPTAEMGTAHTSNTVSIFNTATVNADGFQQEGLLLPTREELRRTAYDNIQFWMEAGHSQLLSREQALEIAVWGLKIAGEKDLQHQVLAELVVLPEEALQPL